MNLKIMMMMSCTDYIDDVDVDIHDDLDEDHESNDDDDWMPPSGWGVEVIW